MESHSRAKPATRIQQVRRVTCPDCAAPPGEKCTSAAGGTRESNHQARQRAHRREFSPVPSIRADRGHARDRFGRELESGRGDTALRFGGMCNQPGCDEPLVSIESSVNTSRGWSHRACAPGADDE